MRIKTKSLLLSTVTVIAVLLSTPLAQATVYSGYDKIEFMWGVQKWKLWVEIRTFLGDLNEDGVVDDADLDIVSAAFGSYPGHPNWDPRADVDNSGFVDIFDAISVSNQYGKTGHIWWIKWKVEGWWPYTPVMYTAGQLGSYIKLWDDEGWSWSWGPMVIPAHGLNGELTFEHPNTYTWTHTEVRWSYSYYFNLPARFDCRVDIYVAP